MSYLQIKQLTSGYGKTLIIRNVSIEVEEGEIVCILGRNGSGKTTLLKTIMGLLPTSSGDIFINERDITNLKPFEISDLSVSYAPQEKGIFPDLTVEQNLKVGFKNKARTFEKSCEKVIEFFPIIGDRLKQKAGTLSGGETKMLILARTIINEPKVMILDEVTEGVQPSNISIMTQALQTMKERGTTIIMVEQNIDFALDIADHYGIMVLGEIKSQGEVKKGVKSFIENQITL